MTKPSFIYKIHPAIGIARVGNAEADQFFIGPEIPGLPATGEPPGTTVPKYKVGGKIKPQAARFRIWEYKLIGNKYTPQREITLTESDVVYIYWTVHLANRKASFHEFDGEAGEFKKAKQRRNFAKTNDKKSRLNFEIDPGARTINGKNMKGVEFKKGTSADPAKETWPNPQTTPPIEYLGELRTDNEGRLIVIGGKGTSATNVTGTPILNYANNDKWFDDVSDGPITAKVELRIQEGNTTNLAQFEASGAWVIVGPPDFAPHIGNVVTLYDTLYDLAARKLTIPTDNAIYDTELKSLKDINLELKIKGRRLLQDYQPSFNKEIYPILKHASDIIWLFKSGKPGDENKHFHYHDSVGGNPTYWKLLADKTSGAQNVPFGRLRLPYGLSSAPSPKQAMPKLLGDEPYKPGHERYRLALTRTQYSLLRQWQQGKFIEPTPTPSKPKITPAGLDRAALDNCVGGAFYPGIEVGWQIRHAALYAEPFRINHKAKTTYRGETGTIQPGHFSRQMALPWQADFRDCKSEGVGEDKFGWWPAQRPDQVFVKASDFTATPRKMVEWHRPSGVWAGGAMKPSYKEMVDHWYKLGFIIKIGAHFLETDRAASVP